MFQMGNIQSFVIPVQVTLIFNKCPYNNYLICLKKIPEMGKFEKYWNQLVMHQLVQATWGRYNPGRKIGYSNRS